MTTTLLPPQLADAEWPARARCREPHYNPEWWWAIPGTAEADHAQRICLRICPVRIECLIYATEAGERDGIWGGLTEPERRRRNRANSAFRTTAPRPEPARINRTPTVRRQYNTAPTIQSGDVLEAPHDDMVVPMVEMLRAGMPRRVVAARLNISRETIDRWCSRYRLWRLESRRRP